MCSISPRCLPPFSIWVPESVSKGFGFGKGSQMFQTDSNMQNQSAFLSHWFSLTPLTLGQVHQLHQPSFRTCFEHIKWRLCCKSFKGSSTVTLYKAAWRSQGVKETKGSENHSVKLSNSLINFFVCLWLHADTQCQYSDGTSPIVVPRQLQLERELVSYGFNYITHKATRSARTRRTTAVHGTARTAWTPLDFIQALDSCDLNFRQLSVSLSHLSPVPCDVPLADIILAIATFTIHKRRYVTLRQASGPGTQEVIVACEERWENRTRLSWKSKSCWESVIKQADSWDERFDMTSDWILHSKRKPAEDDELMWRDAREPKPCLWLDNLGEDCLGQCVL